MKFFSKKIIAWCFYDWANSAFSAIITTFIFATYFTEKVAINKFTGTEQWGNAISIAAVFIALSSPFFGAIADYQGRRKPWLAFFTLITILATAALWYIKPETSYVILALGLVVLAEMGSEVSYVFYNAMLRDLASDDYLGRLSGWGWGSGYLGGLLALILCLVLFIENLFGIFHLDAQTSEQVRIIGPFVALWVLVFSTPLFIFTPDRPRTSESLQGSVVKGIKELFHTLRKLKYYKNIFKFLLARMVYIDGLNTVFAFGGIYAAGTFGFTLNKVIMFGIAANIAAGFGAVGFAWLDDWFGSIKVILLSILIMLVAGCIILSTNSLLIFWIFGVGLCVAVGPIQAASRSLMIRISPPEMLTEFFGLYTFAGRATAFIAPWLLGLTTVAFHSQRAGMGVAFAFLLAGGLLLLLVRSPKRSVEK